MSGYQEMGRRMTNLWVSEKVWKTLNGRREVGDSMDKILRRVLGLDDSKDEEVGLDGNLKIQGE